MLLALECVCLCGNRHLLGQHVEINLQARQGRQLNPFGAIVRGVKPQLFHVAAAYP